VAEYIFHIARRFKEEMTNNKICLLFGGEPTVKVTGSGLGGRNQHLALLVADLIKNTPGITFLSGGTDGTDGPTDAAGAVVDSLTSRNALNLHLDMEQHINNCDAYHFFKQEGGLIVTGPTQTNVMDLMIVLID
jgi:hydroxypyruvate reductase